MMFIVTCFAAANPEPVLNSPLQPTIYDLEISIHYRKREMLKGTFHTARLQLHYLHEAPELNTNHLCFPSTDDLLDHKQVITSAGHFVGLNEREIHPKILKTVTKYL